MSFDCSHPRGSVVHLVSMSLNKSQLTESTAYDGAVLSKQEEAGMVDQVEEVAHEHKKSPQGKPDS